MENYFLPDYKLSCLEMAQSLLVSEYGLRHLAQADLSPEYQWGHRVIALIQFIPVVGQIAMLVEWIAAQAFKEVRERNEMLFLGTQIGAVGPAPIDRVLPVLANLHRRKERGIEFNPAKITGHVEGGTCTSMALDFADFFFKLRKVHVKTGGQSSEPFLNAIRQLGRRFARSSEQMRIRQAAYNTIEVTPGAPGIDFARNKVQSLVSDYGFRIDHASREIDVEPGLQDRAIEREVSDLPNGLYFLRTIKPSANERLEENGHSLIYVKEGQEGFFYDSNYGARYLLKTDHSSVLTQSLNSCFRQFQTSKARFYRLQPS
ncbi:MAG: hypothetical protein JSS60_06095 [Verrucomicrobia bacterium]|nr:hypothetical protein [Verrucomicrobiota bacterium]